MFSALCFTTPFQLGKSFKRVRYNFHLNFFHLLDESDKADILWNEIADIFGEIWDLCIRHAPPEDLEEHLPTVDGYSPEVLVDWWRAWEPRQRGAFLTSLVETLEFEADGDHARGRRILAKKLRKVSALLQKTRENIKI
ncbi:MAG: hypothetical protein CL920_10290 [Deltaproteobacteria bacterium]|nr:hypothetical protein [Deltaproteobacteria bacterium]|tara:strand:+ start:4808 stop:5224 length:417 start_codon:yes stop_codon:yes gene_type:complete